MPRWKTYLSSSCRPSSTAIASSRIHSRSGKDFLHRLRGCYLHTHVYIPLDRICTAISTRVHTRATGDHVRIREREKREREREGEREGGREEKSRLPHVVYIYTRISSNTRSSNPLLETRLIPRIAICLWRSLLRRYWLRVISCKLGCLAAGSLAPGARSHVCKPGTRTPGPLLALNSPSTRSIRQVPVVRHAAHALRGCRGYSGNR